MSHLPPLRVLLGLLAVTAWLAGATTSPAAAFPAAAPAAEPATLPQPDEPGRPAPADPEALAEQVAAVQDRLAAVKAPASSTAVVEAPVSLDDAPRAFSDAVSAELDDYWASGFAQAGLAWEAPQVFVDDHPSRSPCYTPHIDPADPSPFYCTIPEGPEGEGEPFYGIHLQTSFFEAMAEESEAWATTGEFAVAYIIAHEYGHHVQQLLGTPEVLVGLTEIAAPNAVLTHYELQADCLAGVWSAHADAVGVLAAGDIEQAQTAAMRVGDDVVLPDAREDWTHGSGQQRRDWFDTGLSTGDPAACDTLTELLDPVEVAASG